MPLLATSSGSDPSLTAAQLLGSGIKAHSFDPSHATTGTNPAVDASTNLRFIRIDVGAPITATGLKFLLTGSLTALGTGSLTNKVGLYALGTTGISLIAASANTPTLFTQSAGFVGAAFSSPTNIQPGIYWGALLSMIGTGPTGAATLAVRAAPASSLSVTLDLPTNVRNYMTMTAQTDLPGTIGTLNVPLWSSLGTSGASQPYVAIY